MIEVEVRGRLSDEEAAKLTSFLASHGTLIEEQDREMILLKGYPGYSSDPIVRDTDIRLRDTNGSCEIMVKNKSGDHNVARHEISLPFAVENLELPKQIMKALGFSSGLWMHRKKKVFMYKEIEWSVVEVPHNLCYFEAEQVAQSTKDVGRIREHLTSEAEALGLSVLGPAAMKTFIGLLDKTVNKEIEW